MSLKKKNLHIEVTSGVSLDISDSEFLLTVGQSTLSITKDGKLLFNKQPLAFAEIVNIIFNDGTPGIGISGPPGSPAPLHPKVIAKLTAGMAAPAIGPKALFTNK